jgi:transposase
MVKPLSNDLRERVVAFVEAGHSRRAAAAHFRVSPSFVIKLMMLFRQTGRVDHRQLGGQRRFKLDRHRSFILERVAERADITMPELAVKLALATGTRRPLVVVALADPQRLSFQKKHCGPANKTGQTSARRAANGLSIASLGCGRPSAGWCSLTRLGRRPR